MMLKNGLIVKWLTNLQTSVLYWRAGSKEQGSKSRDQRAGSREHWECFWWNWATCGSNEPLVFIVNDFKRVWPWKNYRFKPYWDTLSHINWFFWFYPIFSFLPDPMMSLVFKTRDLSITIFGSHSTYRQCNLFAMSHMT